MRYIIILLSFFLVSCQSVKTVAIRGSVIEYLHDIPENSMVQINKTLQIIEEDKVVFQGGLQVPKERELNRWFPACSLLFNTKGNYTVKPGFLMVTKVDMHEEGIYEKVRARITTLSLQSKDYPEITALSCELWIEEGDDARLGDFIKVAEFHSTTNNSLVIVNEQP